MGLSDASIISGLGLGLGLGLGPSPRPSPSPYRSNRGDELLGRDPLQLESLRQLLG